MHILDQEINLPIKVIGPYNGGLSLKLGYGTKDSDALLHYMYYDGFPIALARKATFVNQIPDYQRHEIVGYFRRPTCTDS
jgi:hypothetical protein